jgi:uridine kinase
VLSGNGEGLDLLRALKDSGALAGTLLVTPREHFVAWARKEAVAVLNPEPGASLRQVLSLGELALRDAAILILHAKRQREERPLLIGINGINKAGKTEFSRRLAGQLERLGFATELVSLEVFTAPKKTRQAKDYSEPERLYYKHYQMDRLQEQLLEPMRSGRFAHLVLDVYDLAKERVVSKRNLTLDRNSMVFLEGPFLFQEDLFTSFDFRIYLVSDFERALELELGGLQGKERERRRDEIVRVELAAQSLYLRKETPWKRAQLVIRGMNTDSPHIESWPHES